MKHEKFKVEKLENSKVSRQTFDDTNELSNYLKNATTNKLWQKRTLCSNQRREDGFNDFDCFDDALKALEYGTDIYYSDFKINVKKVKDFMAKKQKNKNANYKNDKVGFLPIVPNVLQGNPINMINQDIKPKPFPTAKIILEKSNSCGIDAEDMNEYYSIIFVLIQMLEEKGIRCEIWVTDNSCEDDEIISLKVKLKSYTQPLNLYKIQFPVIATDFHRRIYFRIKETNPDIKIQSWTFGYGTPILREYDFNNENRKEGIYNVIGVEEKDIYVPSCQYFGYTAGDNLDKSIKKIIQKTNFKNYINLD